MPSKKANKSPERGVARTKAATASRSAISKSSSSKKKKTKIPETPSVPARTMPTATAWSSDDDVEFDDDDDDENLDLDRRLPAQPVPFYVDDDRPLPQVVNLVSAATSESHQPGSEAAGQAVLSTLLAPLPLNAFFETCFEQRPVLVRRRRRQQRQSQGGAVVQGLFSLKDLYELLEKHEFPLGTGVDIVRFDAAAGVRRTLNGQQRNALVKPSDLRSALSSGASARILHPQRHHSALRAAIAALEGFFGVAVGSNAYISPSGKHQGFAPHYDDVDVFIVQLAGRKRWKVYGPRTEAEVLPRWPSGDFREEELGPLMMDVVLRRGDVLYLPRGTVHCASTVADVGEKGEDDDDEEEEDGADDEEEEGKDSGDADGGPMLPSLHLTVSVFQRSTWADLLAVALPRAVELAAASDVRLRMSLPRGLIHSALGVAREDAAERAREAGGGGSDDGGDDDDESVPVVRGGTAPRSEYLRRARIRDSAAEALASAAEAVVSALPLDAAADRIAADFLLSRMRPPVVAAEEKKKKQKQQRRRRGQLLPSLVRPACGGTAARLCVEGDSAVVYHCLSNESEAHASAAAGKGATAEGFSLPGRIELSLDAAPALELLLGVHSARPGEDAVRVSDLPGIDDEDEDEETAAAVREALEALLDAGVVVEVDEEEEEREQTKRKKRSKKS